MCENKKKVIMGLSVLPMGWGEDISKGMPSIYLSQKGLVNAGFETHYVLLSNSKEIVHKCVEGIHLHKYYFGAKHIHSWAPFYYLSDWAYWLRCQFKGYFILKKLSKVYEPNIFVGHTRYCILPSRIISRKRKKPCLFREYGTNDMYDMLKHLLGRILLFPRILSFKVNSDAMLLTDDGTKSKDVAVGLGVEEKRIYFWKNGIFDTQFIAPKEVVKDKFIISAAARLSPEKHFDVIIKSITKSKNINNIVLYIIGDGPLSEELQSLVNEKKVTDQVVFTGGVSREEVLSYFKASDIVISLGSINPLLESMACGKAVITMNLGSTGEIIQQLENGIIIDNSDPDLIAKYIDDLYENSELLNKLGQNAKKTINENYLTWEQRINNEIMLINKMIGVNDNEE